jgi:glycosyltransferase involved in cell wall biosynthesis
MRGPRYVGQVPRALVAEEFRRADVFVLPTICDSFGIVLVEAMAMGVPVITTPNCGDVVRDGVEGFVVPPRDSRTLAERIRQVVEDRDLRERMSQRARERVQEFSLASYSARLVRVMLVLHEEGLDVEQLQLSSPAAGSILL